MKKLISLLLAASMLLSLGLMLGACNGEDSPEDTSAQEQTTAAEGGETESSGEDIEINEISFACSLHTTTYDLASVLPEGGELKITDANGQIALQILDGQKIGDLSITKNINSPYVTHQGQVQDYSNISLKYFSFEFPFLEERMFGIRTCQCPSDSFIPVVFNIICNGNIY